MISPNIFPTPAVRRSEPILRLEIKGLGHVPSFKNCKRIVPGNPPRLITDPPVKRWMEKAIASIFCQLLSVVQTKGNVTLTVDSQPCLTACALPVSDSRHTFPEIHVKWEQVEKGQEGAVIELYTI